MVIIYPGYMGNLVNQPGKGFVSVIATEVTQIELLTLMPTD